MQKQLEEFDYLNSDISEAFNKSVSDRSGEMFEKEVNEKVRLLYNLKYSAKESIARIKNNIEWEFDHTWNKDDPAILKRLNTIVKGYYKTMKGKLD
jgi:hypothetical protein